MWLPARMSFSGALNIFARRYKHITVDECGQNLLESADENPEDIKRPQSFPLGDECALCFKDIAEDDKPSRQPCNINTLICDECKEEYSREQIQHLHATEIECLCNCGTEWPVSFIRDPNPDLYEQHMQQLAEAALAQVPGFKTCPACSSGAIHADANADHPRIICQSCGVAACFVCGARWEDDGHTCHLLGADHEQLASSSGSSIFQGGNQQVPSQRQLEDTLERISAQLKLTEASISVLQVQRETANEVLQEVLDEQRRINRAIYQALWHERLENREFNDSCACMAYVVWRCVRVTFEQLFTSNETLEDLEREAEQNQTGIRLADRERCFQPHGERSMSSLHVRPNAKRDQLDHLRSRCIARSQRRWAFMPVGIFLDEVTGTLRRITEHVDLIRRTYDLTSDAIL